MKIGQTVVIPAITIKTDRVMCVTFISANNGEVRV